MRKNLVILGFVFGVLLGAFLFFNHDLNRVGMETEPGPLLSFHQDEVAAFQINNFAEGYRFEKTDAGWNVKRVPTELKKSLAENNENCEGSAGELIQDPSDPAKLSGGDCVLPLAEESVQMADPVKVTRLLTHLFLIRVSEPIATSPDAASLFHINPHSLHIIFYSDRNEELGRLYVGKQGPDLMSSFVKRGDEPAVYLVEKNLHGLILLPFEEWFAKEDIKSQDEKNPAKKE